MQRLILITGGQKSGKSSHAQKRALELDPRPMYLATSRIWDEEYRLRIQRHQMERDERWINFEAEKEISSHNKSSGTVLVDCITLWLTNIFTDLDYELDASLAYAKAQWEAFEAKTETCIAIANEISLGLHAETAMGRRFVDLQGLFNQYLASRAQEVQMMVCGIPLQVKS